MKKMLMGATALAMVGGASFAGGLDRSGQGINILFEEGTVGQFSLSYVDPSISGSYLGTSSGDVGESYYTPHFAFKTSVGENTDIALIYDEPFGAHVLYANTYALSQNPLGTPGADQLRAEAETEALTAILRQRFNNGFSVYGGLRAQSVEASVDVPVVAGYETRSDSPTDLGWTAGVAWEKPEIAARVALTYNSSIKHTLSSNESGRSTTTGLPYDVTNDVEIETPESWNLDFQTGVAANTLVFGTIRWVNWSDFDYTPPIYEAATGGALVDYEDDTITYTLGVGHRFTDAFSGAIQLGYEKSNGNLVSNLGPTDGFFSIGIGGTYTRDKTKYSVGLRYIDIGDATTSVGGASGAEFSGNDAWALGFQVTHRFD